MTIEPKKCMSEYFQIKVPGVLEEVEKRDQAKAFIIDNVLNYKAKMHRRTRIIRRPYK